jgi:hypothetical protein
MGTRETGLEGVEQIELELAYFYGFDFHGFSSSLSYRFSERVEIARIQPKEDISISTEEQKTGAPTMVGGLALLKDVD